MIIDYRTDILAHAYHVVDAATGEPINHVFYADDEAGACRTYLVRPGREGLSGTLYYLWNKNTHEPLPADRTIYAGDPDEHDWDVACAEVRRPIRIVRRDAAGAA